MTTAAFFDLDNTVVQGSSLFPFATSLVRNGNIGAAELAHFAWMNARFMLTRTESLSGRDFVTTKALGLVAGQRVDDVMDLCRRTVPSIVRRRTNIGVVQEIRRHRNAGAQTWLVTASPVELASEIARVLGMTGALGTRARIVDDVYTGELAGPILHGEMKADAITALAAVEELDLQQCSAYSDSVNDLPMLSLVGNVTVVNANRNLQAIAQQNGWAVMRHPGRAVPGQPTRMMVASGRSCSSRVHTGPPRPSLIHEAQVSDQPPTGAPIQ